MITLEAGKTHTINVAIQAVEPILPIIQTTAVSAITGNGATLNGNISTFGTPKPGFANWVIFGYGKTNKAGTTDWDFWTSWEQIADEVTGAPGLPLGNYSVPIVGLDPGTIYYFEMISGTPNFAGVVIYSFGGMKSFQVATSKVLLTWQNEVFLKDAQVFSGTAVPTRFYLIAPDPGSLYRRMLDNPALTIAPMTNIEREMISSDISNYISVREAEVAYAWSMGDSTRASVSVPSGLRDKILYMFWCPGDYGLSSPPVGTLALADGIYNLIITGKIPNTDTLDLITIALTTLQIGIIRPRYVSPYILVYWQIVLYDLNMNLLAITPFGPQTLDKQFVFDKPSLDCLMTIRLTDQTLSVFDSGFARLRLPGFGSYVWDDRAGTLIRPSGAATVTGLNYNTCNFTGTIISSRVGPIPYTNPPMYNLTFATILIESISPDDPSNFFSYLRGKSAEFQVRLPGRLQYGYWGDIVEVLVPNGTRVVGVLNPPPPPEPEPGGDE